MMKGTSSGVFRGADNAAWRGALGGCFKGLYNERYIWLPETLAWYQNLTEPKPSVQYLKKVDMFITRLKAAGIWQQLDRLWIFATEKQQHSLVSLVNPLGINTPWPTNISMVGGGPFPTWVALKGWTGLTTSPDSGALNTNWSISQGPNASIGALYSYIASITAGLYHVTDVSNSIQSGEMGYIASTGDGSILFNPWESGAAESVVEFCLNGGAIEVNTGSGKGNFLANNINGVVSAYLKGVFIGNHSNAINNTYESDNWYACGLNTPSGTGIAQCSGRQVAMIYMGGGGINQLAFYHAIQTFAIQVGFAV
ncbi:MAG: hypothetical protein ACLQQ4_07760 [Bacteroidia bacterium]